MAGTLFQVERFVVDSSILIELGRTYPKRALPGIWSNLSKLTTAGMLLFPREVYREIENGSDDAVSWSREHSQAFYEEDLEQQREVKRILLRCPRFSDPSRTTPHADPWVVALAIVKGCTVVSNEKNGRVAPAERDAVKIPDVCSVFGVQHLRLLDFIERTELGR